MKRERAIKAYPTFAHKQLRPPAGWRGIGRRRDPGQRGAGSQNGSQNLPAARVQPPLAASLTLTAWVRLPI